MIAGFGFWIAGLVVQEGGGGRGGIKTGSGSAATAVTRARDSPGVLRE